MSQQSTPGSKADPLSGRTNLGAQGPTHAAEHDDANVDGVGGDPDGREKLIREAAYRLYQERGATGETELEDWLSAEKQVDDLLRSGKGHGPGSR
jgi:hypothetical protein